MYPTRSSVGRGYINTPTGAKEVVIISSSQTTDSQSGSKVPVKISTSTTPIQPKGSITLQQLSQGDNESSTPPSVRYTLSSGVKVLTLTPGSTKNSPLIMKRPADNDYGSHSNRFPRSTDKSKGLRHFSTKVCDKVREKGVTNYNEVADELVQEYFESLHNPPSSQEKQIYDQKNIRRRVYDALNVLMAMNIITKEKKEIRWVGLPTSSVQESNKLEEEKARRLERIAQKTEQLKDLVLQLIAFKSLVERNKVLERTEGKPIPSAILPLPYVIVTADKDTEVDCGISQDKTEYLFKFDKPFEILEDNDILKRLGFTQGLDSDGSQLSPDTIQKLKSYLPVALREYVDEIASGNLLTKFVPAGQSNQPKSSYVPRFYDRFDDKSRSLDAADMEVAMTFSAAGASSTSGSGAAQPPYRSGSQDFQHQQHSYFQTARIPSGAGDPGAAAAAYNSSSRDHPRFRETPHVDEDDDVVSQHSDFSDFESIESNSNQGF